MIEHEMLFLGLLMDGPKHGYEIKRRIEEELFPFIGLKIKSIYYPLKKMELEKMEPTIYQFHLLHFHYLDAVL